MEIIFKHDPVRYTDSRLAVHGKLPRTTEVVDFDSNVFF